MSDALKKLKLRILEDDNIEKLLEALGCTYIQHFPSSNILKDDLVTAMIPDSDNRRAVQIYKNENLTGSVVNRNVSGDIYDVAGYLLYGHESREDSHKNIYEIKRSICELLGYDVNSDEFREKRKVDWNSWLRSIQKARVKEVEIVPNKVLNESVLEEYIDVPWYGWMKEGISYTTQRVFGVRYDFETSRVVFPIHNRNGELIGVKGRYVGDNKKIARDVKYKYLHQCSKTLELFNYHRAVPYAKKEKAMYVLEGAKSCMLLHSMGIYNSVSIEGDKLSFMQAELLKDLGKDIRIIFCFDKDKPLTHVLGQIRQIRAPNIFYAMDNKNRFADRDSPADRTKEDFLGLIKEGTENLLEKLGECEGFS